MTEEKEAYYIQKIKLLEEKITSYKELFDIQKLDIQDLSKLLEISEKVISSQDYIMQLGNALEKLEKTKREMVKKLIVEQVNYHRSRVDGVF